MAIALTFLESYYLAARITTNLCGLFCFIATSHEFVDISAIFA